MANLSKMTDAQLKSQLSKLKKIVARTSNDVAKGKMQDGIDKIDNELADRKKPTSTSTSKPKPPSTSTPKPFSKPKQKPKATAKEEEEEAPKPKRKARKKPTAEKQKPSVKRKGQRGVQMLSTKTVLVNGEELKMNSQEFCDYLLAEFKERRIKADEKKAKNKKTKTKSVMTKVTDNIEKGITQAIKESVRTNKAIIEKNPREFFSKVKKLEVATKSFLNSLKSVLGKEFDGKEVTSTVKGIQDLVNELKKKVEK